MKIILNIVNKIEPKIIWFLFSENIFFSIKGNKDSPNIANRGNLKKSQVNI